MRQKYAGFLCALCLAISGCAGHDYGAFSYAPISFQPAIPATVIRGRFESCLVNPPLKLVTSGLSEKARQGAHVLQSEPHKRGTAVLLVFGPDPNSTGETAAFVVDELAVTSTGVISSSGEAWKVLHLEGTGREFQLKARTLDYSVCRLVAPAVPASAWKVVQRGFGSNAARMSASSGSLTAAAASMNIFGVEPASYVRLRLSSQPTGADILVGGLKHSARTNTILDVLAEDLPQIRLEKAGFEPCSFGQWVGTFEPGSRRVLNASCKLTVKRRGKNRR